MLATGASFVYELARFIRDPQDTPQLFKLVDLFFEGIPRIERLRLEERYAGDPGFRAMYLEGGDRYLSEPFPITKLARLPQGTLGRVFADCLAARGYDPEFYKKFGEDTILDYFATRLGKCHDLWHVLTGFETDVVGEMALMGFYLSQIESPFPATLIVGGIVHLLGTRDLPRLRAAVDEVLAGVRNGASAPKLYGVVWEEHWAEPLAELRQHYQIEVYRRETHPADRLLSGWSWPWERKAWDLYALPAAYSPR
jgi:hypothetical protein